ARKDRALELRGGPAGDGRVVVAAPRGVAPALAGILRGEQEVDRLLRRALERGGAGHPVGLRERERADGVIVQVVAAAGADASFGILLRDEPLEAVPNDVAEAERVAGTRQVGDFVSREVRVARAEEGQER